jgi:hypothetical protein
MGAPKNSKPGEYSLNSSNQLAPGEVVIGEIEGLSAGGGPLVNFPQNGGQQPVVAMSTVAINAEHKGRQVALLFSAGDLNRPLIIGLIHSPLQDLIDSFEVTPDHGEGVPRVADSPALQQTDTRVEADVDGKRVVIEGQDEVVLKCGEASITLTRAGKIIIRGRYLLNRSTGINRILGGSVQIN